jgi:hypothetical protein
MYELRQRVARNAGFANFRAMPVDASLEAILQELKERGIGRR